MATASAEAAGVLQILEQFGHSLATLDNAALQILQAEVAEFTDLVGRSSSRLLRHSTRLS
jgi:hypothetical protein